MPSRRSVLHLLGTGLVVASGGCASIGVPVGPEHDESTTSDAAPDVSTSESNEQTTTPESDEHTTSDPVLSATEVYPGDVPDDSTLVPVSPRLLDLVSTAAASDGRVDLAPTGGAYSDDPLVVGAFDAVEFRGKTYRPTTKFAYFAQESNYQYSLEAVNESEFDGDTITYANLSAGEQTVVDEMLENGSFDVGYHEEHPDAGWNLREYDGLEIEGETYRLLVMVGDMATHHMLRLDPTTPDEDDQVVTIADEPVPDAIRNTVEWAVSDGTSGIVEPDTIRSFIEDTEFVLTPHAVARLRLVRVTPDS